MINSQAYASMLMNPADFPWKKKTIKELLGDTFLLQRDGKIVSKVRRRKRERGKEEKRKKERKGRVRECDKQYRRKEEMGRKEERSEETTYLSFCLFWFLFEKPLLR